MGLRATGRRLWACGALSLGIAVVIAPVASAQTVTFGADVSQPPMATGHGCTQRPDSFGMGGWYAAPSGIDSSCTWTTPTNPTSPLQGLVTPTGTGTITAVRIHVGASTGPMQLVVLNFEYNPANGNTSCCNAAYVSQPFTPTADSITTLQTQLPVHTDAAGHPSAGPYEVADMLALSVDEDGVAIPLIDYTNRGLPVNELPSDNIHWPAYVQGQTDLMPGYYGYQLDMNADWVSGTSNPPPTPTVTIAGSTPTVKHGKVNVGLDCGAGAACAGTITIGNQPLAGATAARKKKIVYASGTFSLGAGQNATVAVPLKGKGKAAAKHHKKLTVYINVTVGSDSTAKKSSKKVKLRF